jgi:sugar/nucleoside kinase (ribokinase family)
MKLITRVESENILKDLGHLKWKLSPGGSAANMLSGASALGNRVAFLGVVGKDKFGRSYESRMEKEGIVSRLSFHDSAMTGHAIILVTPDGERTMATHLGAALNFSKDHLKEDEIKSSRILHIEAYQLENATRQTILRAVEVAKDNDVKVSLDLSDAGLVRRNRKAFYDIIRDFIDVVFANKEEALEFTGLKDPQAALSEIAGLCSVAAVKLGAEGSLIKNAGKIFCVKPYRVKMINTTGAGDNYAAGILHGLVNDLDLKDAGNIASYISALVVASAGAHLDRKHLNLISKFKKHGRKRKRV